MIMNFFRVSTNSLIVKSNCKLITMKIDKIKIKTNFMYSPKSSNQKKYIQHLNDEKVDLILAVGPAGTGKTLFACLHAISLLKSGSIRKIILTRPVIPVEEDIGFLPGNIVKKMDPWTKPIFDLFLEYFSKTEIDNYIHNNVIEISPLAYMRGRTFKNSFIIADEMQNSSPNQMKMLTTRIGIESKMVITGDLNQSDKYENNGLYDLIKKINNYDETSEIINNIKIINLEKEDIERSDIVKKIINIYNEKNNTITDKKKLLNDSNLFF